MLQNWLDFYVLVPRLYSVDILYTRILYNIQFHPVDDDDDTDRE